VTPKQVAEELGVKRRLVYKLIASGELSAYRVRKLWRVTPDALEAYRAANSNQLTAA
jgi:excisionase family DNA binding protein